MSKNDERVLKLKKIINEKKTKLKEVKRFVPLTNCVLSLENQKYNLNVLQLDELKLLLVKLNMYLMSANNLGIQLEFSGYNIEDWLEDTKSKIEILEHKKKESELKELEKELDKLLSDEKRTELQLDKIAELLSL